MNFRFGPKAKVPALPPRLSVPEIWSDEHGIALRGWILTPNGPPTSLELVLDGQPIPVASWHSRPDLIAKFPQYHSGEKCGFRAYLPRTATHKLSIHARTGDEIFSRQLTLKPKPLRPEGSAKDLFKRFLSAVNEEGLDVLEIGSRVVVPGSASRRTILPRAGSYTGFDLYPDENTDVVGDAHRLSSHFPARRFDAVFSVAVLEHLAMPWLVAAEINKVLRPGGLTFHLTHFTFPLHEEPADYWRFSEEGLRALFSPALGFGKVETEFLKPASLHPHQRTADLLHLPGQPAYLQVGVLARKESEIDDATVRWPAPPTAALNYPAPAVVAPGGVRP